MSDLGLYCLPMSHKKGARLIWVKTMHAIPTKLVIHDKNWSRMLCFHNDQNMLEWFGYSVGKSVLTITLLENVVCSL